MASIESIAKEFRCKHCPKTYTRQQTLQMHRNAIHHGLRGFKCVACNRKFRYSPELSRHKRAHHIHILKRKSNNTTRTLKPWKCDNCDQMFWNESYMKLHEKLCGLFKPTTRDFAKVIERARQRVASKKLMIKLKKCDICDLKFTKTDNFKTHVEEIHSDINNFKIVFDQNVRFKIDPYKMKLIVPLYKMFS